MQRVQNLSAATPETIRQELSQTVARVLKMIEGGKTALDKLQDVGVLLESIPLSTGEYCVAQHRLQNAHRYLVSQEHGAARFELRMLAGSLRNGDARPCHWPVPSEGTGAAVARPAYSVGRRGGHQRSDRG